MIIDDLERVVKEDVLSVDVAEMYLKIYVADIDWKPHIAKLWSNTKNKIEDDEQAKVHIKNSIAGTTLSPYYDNTSITDPPQTLLFVLPTWHQFSQRNWIELYKKMVAEDIAIRRNRKKMLEYGVIGSLDYFPMTRQAFNWLYSKAEESHSINQDNKEDVVKKFENLIKVYGGAVICNLFTKNQKSIDRVLNWRSGYFIEKEIYKVYTFEQISKIKELEISKIDSKYVKKVTKNKEKF